MVPKVVLMRSGLVSLTTSRPVNTAQPRTTVNSARPMANVFNKGHSTIKRHINNKTTTKNSNFNQKVNTSRLVLNAVKGNQVNAVKASACWDNPQQDLQEKGKLMEDMLPLEVTQKDGKLQEECLTAGPSFSQSLKSSPDAGFKPSGDDEKKVLIKRRKKMLTALTLLMLIVQYAVIVVESKKVIHALKDPSWIEDMQEELLQFKLQEVWTLVDLPNGKRAIGTKIEAIRLFLALSLIKDVYGNVPMGSQSDFLYGLQVKHKEDGIFINQDKCVTEILKKFGFTDVKPASTPMETQKPLLKDKDGEEVDVHLYRSMIGSLISSNNVTFYLPNLTCEEEAKRRNSRVNKKFKGNCHQLLYAVSNKEDTAFMNWLSSKFKNPWKLSSATKNVLWNSWEKEYDNITLFNDGESSDDDCVKSNLINHHDTNPFLDPYQTAKDEGIQRYHLKCNDNNSGPENFVQNDALHSDNNNQGNKGICRVDKFEVIKYSIGDNEEFMGIHTLERDS
ncbi:hypothetical protein Tco_1088782 [Tanacetum coccineum]